jgi:hypothetical protein
MWVISAVIQRSTPADLSFFARAPVGRAIVIRRHSCVNRVHTAPTIGFLRIPPAVKSAMSNTKPATTPASVDPTNSAQSNAFLGVVRRDYTFVSPAINACTIAKP